MNQFPWLSALWLVPAVGALLVWMVPSRRPDLAKAGALVVSLVVAVLAIVVAVQFEPGGPQYQFVESHQWIPAFGAGYTLGVDGIALVLVLLTAVLVPLLLLAGWNDTRVADTRADGTRANEGEDGIAGKAPHAYVALILVVEAMVVLAFTALDILLFYVFFEAMLIPMYFLIGGFGRAQDRAARSAAAVKFLLYNLFGGLLMLAAVIGLYILTVDQGAGTFDFRAVVAASTAGELGASPGLLNALFLGFMFAFAVKAPLWPFHSWLPGAAVEATPAGAVLMMAIVDKVGTFAMLRYCLQLFPEASATFAPLIVTLSVIGILYGAIAAIGQTDVMRLIAYTSISHFGFIVLGIFAMTSQSQTGSTLYMVNHGLSTAALFLIAGFLVSRRGSRMIASFGGVRKVAPVAAGTFLVAGLATLSLPGLAPFISEFLVLIGTFPRYGIAAVLATGALVLSAVYVLWLYQRMMTGPLASGNEKVRDLVPRELVVVAPLIALLIVLGLFPKPALDVIDPAVNHTMTTIGQTDPEPTEPGPVLTGAVVEADPDTDVPADVPAPGGESE